MTCDGHLRLLVAVFAMAFEGCLVMRLTLKRKCRLRVPKGQAVSDVRGSSEVCWLRFLLWRSRAGCDETDLEEEVPSESAKRPGSQ